MDNYKTTDFYIACVLKAKGFKTLGLEKVDNRGRMAFVFLGDKSKIVKLVNDYWNDDVIVSAKALVDAVNQFKSRIKESSRF